MMEAKGIDMTVLKREIPCGFLGIESQGNKGKQQEMARDGCAVDCVGS